MSAKIGDRSLETRIGSRERLGGGFRALTEYRIAYTGTDGEERQQERELIEGGRVVGVIAYDTAIQKLIMIRQYRLAAELANGAGQMIEIVAGGVEDGEDAAAAAVREFREETQLEIIAMQPVYTAMPTPGLTTEIVDVFLALADSSNLPARAGEDEDEDIEPFTATLDEALDAADRGDIVNGFTLLALNWFARKGMETVQVMDGNKAGT